jgi:competence protein ComEC
MKSWQKWLSFLLVLVVALGAAAWYLRPDGRLHVYFLNVGQGDATLIRQGSVDILIDGGPSPQAIDNELGKILPFWDRSIELVVMTHPHADHLAGLVEVLDRYDVKEALYPDVSYADPADYDASLYQEWLNLVTERKIDATLAHAYQQLSIGDITIDVLNPPETPLLGTESDVDNNSVVLRVSEGEISFLVTGDLQWEGENDMAYNRRLEQSAVLKVAHHGSDTSSTDTFLNVVMPQIAVISVGENTYGHPMQSVVDRLVAMVGEGNIYRTDQEGSIEFITDGKKLWLKNTPIGSPQDN